MPGCQTLAVGDTVLGNLGIALCGADGGAAVHLPLDVVTGNLSLAHEAGSSSVDALAAANEVGAEIHLERFLCDLQQMNCSWVDAAGALAAEGGSVSGGGVGKWVAGRGNLQLPLMDGGHSRLSMRSRQLEPGAHDGLKISIAMCGPP